MENIEEIKENNSEQTIGLITITLEESKEIHEEVIEQKVTINPEDRFCIFGDIGGTNFRLRIVKELRASENNEIQFKNGLLGFETILEKKYCTQNYQSFAIFLDRLLDDSQVPKEQVVRVVLATCSFSCGVFNYKFINESIQKLEDHFEGKAQIEVLNDVEGMGQSLIYSDQLAQQHKDILIQLRHQNTVEVSNAHSQVKLLFTMGTGAGMSLILPYPVNQPDGTVKMTHFVRASEGWLTYSTVDEQNPRQQELGKYLFKKMKTKSSLMKFCKGPAILNLHQFMETQHPELKSNVGNSIKKALKKKQKDLNKKLRGKQIEKLSISAQECITYAAVNEMDELCMMTIDFMIEILAQTLSNLAHITLPMGGIYIGGGVGNYLASYIEKKQDIFWKYFLGNHLIRESVLEKIPIYVLRENPTIDGLQTMVLEVEKEKVGHQKIQLE